MINSRYVCFDNKFYTEDQPIFKLNRAMKYGDGVFETIRIIEGHLKYLNFHLERMRKGLQLLEINVSNADLKNLEVCINQLLIKNEIEKGGLLRIIAQRRGLGKYTPESNNVLFYLETEDSLQNGYVLNKQGLKIDISKKIKIYPTSFSPYKSLNAIPYVLAAKEKEESKFDELLLLNTKEMLVEATSSNLFIVNNGKVITPNLSDGGVSGIMRRVIINKIKHHNFTFEEREIEVKELVDAQEVFLTNAVHGIQWVGAYQAKRYFKKLSSFLIKEL